MKVRSLDAKTKRKPLTIRDGNTEARGSTVTFPGSVIGPQDDGKGKILSTLQNFQ